MQNFLENAFMVSYVAVVVLSIIKYPKYFDTPLRNLPIILFYTLLTEVLGGIIFENEEWNLFSNELLHFYNIVIYNIYAIIFFLYFFYIYWKYIETGIYKKAIVIGTILFMVASVINPFFQSFLLTSQTWAFVTGSVILLGCTVLFIIEHSRLGLPIPWWYNLMYWISAGLIIFYGAYLPIELYRYHNYLTGANEPMYLRSVVHLLILLMNISFCIGFLLIRHKPLSTNE